MVQPRIAKTPNQVQEVAEAFQASEVGRLYGHHADTNPKFITHAEALENARLALADW